jgi:hypothetical protein
VSGGEVLRVVPGHPHLSLTVVRRYAHSVSITGPTTAPERMADYAAFIEENPLQLEPAELRELERGSVFVYRPASYRPFSVLFPSEVSK